MKRRNKADVLTEKRVDAAFRQASAGRRIKITDITLVFREGRRLVADGADDAALLAGLRNLIAELEVMSIEGAMQ